MVGSCKPDAVRIFLQHVGSDLQGQTCLAEAAHSKQGQQPRALEQALGIGKLALAPDERGNLLRQIVRRRFERTQRREILAEAGVYELVDMLARRQVAQPHAAKIAQGYRRRQAPVELIELIDHGLGAAPAPVSGLHDPGRPVDRAAEKVVGATLDHTQMQSGAHAERDMIVCGQAGQRLLQCRGG